MSTMWRALLTLLMLGVVLEMGDLGQVTATVRCASCEGVNCVPPPPGCQLGRRPCSCCHECRVREGGECGPFTPECESHLVCHTYDGQMYVGRPSVDSLFSGRCIHSPGVPTPSARLQGIRKQA